MQDENLNLNGIWERIDSDSYEDTVYVTQEGNEITATGEPTWYCYDDINNRAEGTEFAPHRLVFRGTLTGDEFQGKTTLCDPWQKTAVLEDLHLTVSQDGKSLNGVLTGWGPYNWVFVSPPAATSIEMRTDKPSYGYNEHAEISGQVHDMTEESQAFIEIYGPDNNLVFSDYVPVNSDGYFSVDFGFNNDNTNGTYSTVASYAGTNDEITFEYGVQHDVLGKVPIQEWPVPRETVIIGGTTAAGAAAGILYKQGYFKSGKYSISGKEELAEDLSLEQDSQLPLIELRVECGLENPELINGEGGKSSNMIAGEITELERKLNEGINKILESRKKLKFVQKDVEFIKWCREAKENPNKLLSKISQDVIGKFLSSIEPNLQNLLLSKISVESDISVTNDRPKEIKKNITFSLIPIQAYIELVVYSNGLRVSSTKFVFTVTSYVKIKNLIVHLAKVNLLYENAISGKSSTGKRIEVENLLFGIKLELSKLKIGLLEKAIEPPIGLGKKETEIKNLLFFSG
jgi:hypothetical protein